MFIVLVIEEIKVEGLFEFINEISLDILVSFYLIYF